MEHVERDSRAAAQASTARSGARTARRLRGCPRARSARLDPVRKFFTHGLGMRRDEEWARGSRDAPWLASSKSLVTHSPYKRRS